MNKFLLTALATLMALLAYGCSDSGDSGDGSGSTWPNVQELEDQTWTPLPQNSQILVGDSRMVIGFLNEEEGELLLGGTLDMRFYKIDDEEGTLKGEVPGTFISLEEEEGAPPAGAYVAYIPFDEAGDWGVEIDGAAGGEELETIRYRFNVLEDGPVPSVGDPAPRSEQLTMRDVDDVSEIDSSDTPRPELHELTVAEALDLGKPVVITFSTPQFCSRRICGPVLDQAFVPVWERYGDQATFLHIEPYDLEAAQSGEGLSVVPAMAEWGLGTEPWVFVVDASGNVRVKFEGLVTATEVEQAVQSVLS
jgi:hypothetical protein